MMHPADETLRALLDQELRAEQIQDVTHHLERCPRCRARLSKMAATAGRVSESMRANAPRRQDRARSPEQAYNRLTNHPRFSMTRKESMSMLTRRPLWTALAVIAILALVFTLTPASAWASDFLGLFRIQKITVIQFDPGAIENNALRENRAAIEQVLKQNLEIQEGGEPQPVTSVEAAAAAAGFTPRLPSALDDAQLAVQPGMQAVLTIDREKMQALLDVAGVEFTIPANMDGEKVTVEAQRTVLAGYGCQPEERSAAPVSDCILLVQLPSPTIDAPEGLNLQRVGEAMLRFLGLSSSEARAISQRVDWTTTLILPIPQGENLAYQEVQVDGVTGTLIQDRDNNSYALLWVKDGFLYGLKGIGEAEDGLQIANTMP